MEKMDYYRCLILFASSLLLLNGYFCADSELHLNITSNGTKCPGTCTIGRPYEEFELSCKTNRNLAAGEVINWYVNDTLIPNQNNEKFKIPGLRPFEDIGNYSCRVVNAGSGNQNTTPISLSTRLEVKSFPYVVGSGTVKDHVAFEGKSINLTCPIRTTVKTNVVWEIDSLVAPNVTAENMGRVIVKNTNNDSLITNDWLEILNIHQNDSGHYKCKAESEFGSDENKLNYHVRVKGKYAALWPFLGICIEVILLCLIILIYEKKHDKSETEDSDTDQGAETKNSK